LFEQLDKPALKPLPAAPCEYAEWLERRVGLDYHVEVEKHSCSVPHQLLKKALWVRIAARTVRSSMTASASPLMSELWATAGIRPWRRTCPPAIGATPG